MKLRNKKTGGIGWLETYYGESDEKMIAVLDEKSEYHPYNSLAELNKEWEDYEEPKDKGYWYIDDFRRIQFSSEVMDEIDGRPNNWMIRKLWGNYFNTYEEAEKAVEKLKTWKKLRDKGYYFSGWSIDKMHFVIELRVKEYDFVTDELKQDLNLLFGGENE